MSLGLTTDLDESRARLDREFGDNGGLTWVLRLRPSDRAIGVVGVYSDQGTPIRGVGWYLRRDYWGQGRRRAPTDYLWSDTSRSALVSLIRVRCAG
ncbi:GNAT family N-acetyltransferase [Kribbella sp. VKM Ac-2568]|uniref:GNAT family N-acetyltransferase n=1 Tax=Kribbella sp. VKM Ac-2568 TaxID=2512219 RepID=UPI001046199A|nr:acetyltransferase (GNAT) family protein [Kribbella sp. VKM Ac-2568]